MMTPSGSRYARPSDGSPAGSRPLRDRTGDAAVLAELTESSGPRAAADSRPILIAGGTILSQDRSIGNLTRGDVLVRAGTITAVAPDLSGQAAHAIVVDASDAVVIPGFVDSHIHAWEGQLRNSVPTLDFFSYVDFTVSRYGGLYTPHDSYVGTKLTALVALDAGITTIIDNSHNSRTPDHSNAAVEALMDAGIRGVHASGIPFQTDVPTWPGDVARLQSEYFSSDDQLVTLRLFDAFPSEECWAFAKDHHLWMSHETAGHWVGVLPELAAKGLLTPEHTFNHCTELTDEAWALIVDSGGTVNISARSEAAFGSGPGAAPPTDKIKEFGVRPGLSSDNEISYALNMFAEMQTLLSTDRAQIFRQLARGETKVPEQLTAADLLEFATLRGAVNAAVESRTGSLTPGKDADIVLIRTTDINTAPVNNALGVVTEFAQPGNVDTVFVAGRVRKFRGHLVGHDLDAMRGLVEASRDRIVAAAGRRVDVLADQGTTDLR
jgi:5-methylthioadenosine/S-adenosylhomocysteine deaminase